MGETEGETESCSDGAMLSKSLIQFSVDGRLYRASLIARLVKNLSTMQETWV